MVKIILFLILSFVVFEGCSSNHKIIRVQTQPSGASVLYDGETQSDTPCNIRVPYDNSDHYIFVQKANYRKVRKILRNNDYPDEINLELASSSGAKEEDSTKYDQTTTKNAKDTKSDIQEIDDTDSIQEKTKDYQNKKQQEIENQETENKETESNTQSNTSEEEKTGNPLLDELMKN